MELNTQIKRRQAIRRITVAGGLALSTQWVKPTVSAMVLPAHAMTTAPVMTTALPLMIDRGSFGGNGPLPNPTT